MWEGDEVEESRRREFDVVSRETRRVEEGLLVTEELGEIDGDVGESYWADGAVAMDRFVIGAIGLEGPGGESAFIRVDAPDFRVAAVLVLGEFGLDVVV